MKELSQYAPKPPKTPYLRRWLHYAAYCAHKNILAQNQERYVLPNPLEKRTFNHNGLWTLWRQHPQPDLYPTQGALKCYTEVGETAFATRRSPEKPVA
jgi:hypothetical protein